MRMFAICTNLSDMAHTFRKTLVGQIELLLKLCLQARSRTNASLSFGMAVFHANARAEYLGSYVKLHQNVTDT